MKRLLTTGLVLLGLAGYSVSSAQSKKVYDDDIYYNSKKAKQAQQDEPQSTEPKQQPASSEGETYSSSGQVYDSRNDAYNYNDGDDYVDYQDDYYYSTRFSRFNYPFYNRPYWSSFYNPYWYDPYWVDPYWGYNPWSRPGFYISFGTGPYWSSYWGWQSWYGCNRFNSYYGYPGYGFGGGYYSGYWNGYYAGLYNNYGYGGGRYRTITYGPRYSLDANRNALSHNVGYRGFRREAEAQPGTTRQSIAPVGSNTSRTNGLRNGTDATNTRPVRGAATNMESVRSNEIRFNDREPVRSSDGTVIRDRSDGRTYDNGRTPVQEAPVSDGSRWNNNNTIRSEQQVNTQPAEQPRRERGGFFGNRSESAPARTFEQPRTEQRTYTQPQSQPRFEQRSAPSRGFNGGGGRSSGGGSNGGSGGFRGGRR